MRYLALKFAFKFSHRCEKKKKPYVFLHALLNTKPKIYTIFFKSEVLSHLTTYFMKLFINQARKRKLTVIKLC